MSPAVRLNGKRTQKWPDVNLHRELSRVSGGENLEESNKNSQIIIIINNADTKIPNVAKAT